MGSIEAKKKFLINFAFFSVVILLLYIVFKSLLQYLMPFVIAVVIGIIVQRPARFLHKKLRLPRSVFAVALSILTFILFAFLCGLLGFFMYKQINGFFTALPKYIPKIEDAVNNLSNEASHITKNIPKETAKSLNSLPGNLINSAAGTVTKWLSKVASSTVAWTPQFLISVLVTIVATCYVSADYDYLYKTLTDKAPKKYTKLIFDAKQSSSKTVLKMIKGYLLIMFITFSELTVSLYILGVKFAVVIAALITVVDVLPILGTGTVVIPWGIICLVFGNVGRGIGLLVMYIIITVVRNFIEPKIIGKQVGLYPLLTLFAMFCGLKLFGMPGLLILPLSLILFVDLYRTYRKTENADEQSDKKPITVEITKED